MPSQSIYPDSTPVVRNIWGLANLHNEPKRGPSGNAQLLPAKRSVSVPAGESNSSPGGSSVASTIKGQNSTPSSSLNNSHVADIAQHVTSSPPATLQQWIDTPTTMPGARSRTLPAPGTISQTDSTRCVVSSPPSSIAITSTLLSSVQQVASC